MDILLVDDSKTMRTIQKKALSFLGEVNFLEAADGVEAVSAVAGHKGTLALAIVDWNMPNMDGITFLAKFRTTNKTTPVIMCTTEAEKQRVMDAIRAGANNYVIKPFTPDGLMEKVKATLAKVQAAAA